MGAESTLERWNATLDTEEDRGLALDNSVHRANKALKEPGRPLGLERHRFTGAWQEENLKLNER